MHWFLDPIQNHYADFTGKATRKEFWMYYLTLGLISALLGLLVRALNIDVFIVMLGYMALFALPTVSISVRRLHDTGRSGWWYLVIFIPAVGLILLLIMMALPSKLSKEATVEPAKLF